MDRDQRMRDVSERPARKGVVAPKPHKPRPSNRSRAIDAVLGKDQPSGSSNRNPMTSLRFATSNEGISIRGASAKATTTVARMRRNVLTGSSTTPSSRAHTTGTKTIDLWREFVNKRWNPEHGFLNLEKMLDDPYVAQHRLTPPGAPGSSAREAAVIFKIAGQLKPQVQTLSLANNNISNGLIISTISHYLPKIANLSLEGNALRGWKDIDAIVGKRSRLEHLRELILTGNPVRDLEYKNNRGDQYVSEMTRRIPTLEMLDQQPIAKIGFDVPKASTSAASTTTATATTFPSDMNPSFITGVDGGILSNFLMRYFPSFDSARATLSSAYHPSATFSFSVNTSIPARARIEGFHTSKEMPNQRKLEWGPWISGPHGGSRNLARIAPSSQVKMVKSLHVGTDAIMKTLTNLPGTQHDVTGAPEKFCVDAWPVPTGDGAHLFVTLHGQFAELPTMGIRSFDRSLVLAPAPDGSSAKQAGWDVMILSDQLNVRAYSSHEAWRPGPMKVEANDVLPSDAMASWISSLAPPVQNALQAAISSIPEPQKTLVLQTCQKTRLNVPMALQCLEGNGWDYNAALANFEQVKGNLAPDSFL